LNNTQKRGSGTVRIGNDSNEFDYLNEFHELFLLNLIKLGITYLIVLNAI